MKKKVKTLAENRSIRQQYFFFFYGEKKGGKSKPLHNIFYNGVMITELVKIFAENRSIRQQYLIFSAKEIG